MNLKVRRFIESDAERVSKIVVRNFLEVNIRDYPKEKMMKLAQIYDKDKMLDMSKWLILIQRQLGMKWLDAAL